VPVYYISKIFNPSCVGQNFLPRKEHVIRKTSPLMISTVFLCHKKCRISVERFTLKREFLMSFLSFNSFIYMVFVLFFFIFKKRRFVYILASVIRLKRLDFCEHTNTK
jgi:hypothetical protein